MTVSPARAVRIGIVTVLLGAGVAAPGETLYVIDRIEVGLHEAPATDSAIVATLPSGTELELLERAGALARVAAPSGATGWADTRYLSADPPAQRRVVELGAELDQAAAELVKAREQNAELEYQLRQAVERARIAEEELLAAHDELIDARGVDPEANARTGALREVQRLAEESRRLKDQLTALEAERVSATAERDAAPASTSSAARGRDDHTTTPDDPIGRYLAVREWAPWKQGLLASSLLLAFGAGAWVVDWAARRRHGGFRV